MPTNAKYCINVDKLILAVKILDKSLFADNYDIEVSEKIELNLFNLSSNDTYTRAFKIKFQNEDFAILKLEPIRKYGNKNIPDAIMKIDNFQLYTDSYIDVLFEVLQLLIVRFLFIKELDICIDGMGFLELGSKILEKTILKKGKAQFAPKILSNNELQSYKIGNIKSGKLITCYQKSQEINEKGKQYIKEFWKQNGLTNLDNIDRLELRLKKDFIKRYEKEGFEIKDLKNPKKLISLFKNECKNFFDFVVNDETKKRKDRMKSYSFIDWDLIGCVPLEKSKTNRIKSKGLTNRRLTNMLKPLCLLGENYSNLEKSIDEILNQIKILYPNYPVDENIRRWQKGWNIEN